MSIKNMHIKNMSIKKKLVISNILIVIIPLGLAFGMLAVFVDGIGSQYWETMENIYNDEDEAYTAENLLCWGDHYNEIMQDMRNAGYHYSVIENGEEKISNLTRDDIAKAREVTGSIYDGSSSFTITKGDTTVVREIFTDDGNQYIATGIHTKDISRVHGDSYMKRYITLYIGFIVLVLIVCIVLMNILLTWWISRSILRPLKQMSVSSSLIRDGNLDCEMKSKKKDEMGQAINDFDEMRRHLKQSVEERLKYEQYRKELIVGISHDLRTPLTSIKGYLEGLRDGIASTPEMKLKYYEAIETSVNNLEKLTDDLTGFSKLDADNFQYDKERTELNEYYREHVEELRREYFKDSIDITLEESPDRIYADIDQKKMSRINHNLINNTLKYRKDAHSNTVISLSSDGDNAYISIADDGPGVDEKDIDKIFTFFFRGDASRTEAGKGSGIGLAVVKQIIEGHGGTVKAANDNGLKIIISLPRSKGE